MTIPGFSSRFQLAPDSSKLFPVSVRNRYRDWSSPVDEATTFCKQSRLLGLFFLWKVDEPGLGSDEFQGTVLKVPESGWNSISHLGGISPCWREKHASAWVGAAPTDPQK